MEKFVTVRIEKSQTDQSVFYKVLANPRLRLGNPGRR
jgi:hypothetical protein